MFLIAALIDNDEKLASSKKTLKIPNSRPKYSISHQYVFKKLNLLRLDIPI